MPDKYMNPQKGKYMNSSIKTSLYKCIIFFLLLVCSIKILLIGYDIDEQYAISMSYRLLQGDFPLMDMWEPHQTSAYLITLLMIPYIALTNSLTGIVLYLRFCGLIIHSIISFVLYKHLKKLLNQFTPVSGNAYDYALLLTCIYFFSLPKLMFLPEFSNMQLWFLLLSILHLLNYYNNHTLHHLVFAGIFMTLEVLTYPSTIIAFFVVILYIFYYHKEQNLLKELIAFTLPSLLGVSLFLGCLLSRMSLSQLINHIQIISQDGSHSVSILSTLRNNLLSVGEILLFLLLYGIIAAFIYALLRKKYRLETDSLYLYHLLFIGTTLVGQLLIWLFGTRYPNYPSIEYFLLPLLGTFFVHKKKEKSSLLFSLFFVVPCSGFLGIIIFTNHPLMVSAPFLSLCVIGVLCIYCKHAATHKTCNSGLRCLLLLWVIILIFGKSYLIRTSDGKHYTLFHDVSLIRRGPAIGIIADTDTVKQYNDCFLLAENYLPEDAKLLYAGRSSGIYLLKNFAFCIPSTISTPTYDEKTLQYFNTHPDKLPDYIVCDRNLKDVYTDSWLKRYINSLCSAEPIQTYFYYVYTVDK